ncbi:MAG: carboxyvinyl-carboxyphosphonate phosphorylmutase [Rickettsiales bacterium]|nr:carboxyvinyl-carboxyphosphonate phosphorylmutase [Rickettsiales bacterium]
MGLANRLREPQILVCPGVYDAFTARLVEQAGFDAVFLSGAAVSYSSLGQPDVGLVSLDEMVNRVSSVANAISLPVLADGDNGHGSAVNLIRTTRLFEQAGAAAVQFEDQVFPKRCGHMQGKKLVSAKEMTLKIEAACHARRDDDFLIIGRTDARSVEGLEAAIDRAILYRKAGADILFIESPLSKDELARCVEAIPDVPLVANMLEGGQTPLVGNQALAEMGYRIALWPNSLVRRFAFAGAALLNELKGKDTTAHLLDQMLPFAALNELLGSKDFSALEARYLPPEQAVRPQ